MSRFEDRLAGVVTRDSTLKPQFRRHIGRLISKGKSVFEGTVPNLWTNLWNRAAGVKPCYAPLMIAKFFVAMLIAIAPVAMAQSLAGRWDATVQVSGLDLP